MRYLRCLYLGCLISFVAPATADPSFKLYELECQGNHTQEPWGVAYAQDGTFYVANMTGSTIEHFDACGQLLARWGTEGTGEGQILWPRGIVVDRDTVFVTQTGTAQVRKFMIDGTFLDAFGGYRYLDSPFGIALDRRGFVYVAEAGLSKIVVFDRAGNMVREFPTRFGIDLAFDHNADIYVAGFEGWLQEFTSDGSLLREVQVPGPPRVTQFRSVALDRQGRVHYVHTSGLRILVFSSRLELLGEWQLPPELGPYAYLLDLAFDDQGRAVLTNALEPKITVYHVRTRPFAAELTEIPSTTWGGVKARYRPGAAATAQDK